MPPRMFWATLCGSTPSAVAVAGMSCMMPMAPLDRFKAWGFKSDSCMATCKARCGSIPAASAARLTNSDQNDVWRDGTGPEVCPAWLVGAAGAELVASICMSITCSCGVQLQFPLQHAAYHNQMRSGELAVY